MSEPDFVRELAGMKMAERLITAALQPVVGRIPPHQLALALLRCARVCIRQVPDAEQRVLRRMAHGFIDGKTSMPEDDAPRMDAPRIIVP
jgi:hypothetical protein